MKEIGNTAIARALAVMVAAALLAPLPALAACPIELSIYRDHDDIAEIEFLPVNEEAAVTNRFRMVMPGDLVFDGVVMWTAGVQRPYGIVMHGCPEGDVTGEELSACTLWQGVIYTSDENGAVGLLPDEGTAAPPSLVLADLGYAMQASPAFEKAGLTQPPFDVFELKGCQE